MIVLDKNPRKMEVQIKKVSMGEDCDDMSLLNFYLSNTNSKSRQMRSPPSTSEYERRRQKVVDYIKYVRELIKDFQLFSLKGT